MWHLATGVELLNLEAHAGRVNALAFTPDGAVLASGGETASGAGEVFLWRAAPVSDASEKRPAHADASPKRR